MKQIWRKTVGCAALVAVAGSCTVDATPGEQTDAPQVEVIQMDDAPPGLPFSSVVRVDIAA